MARIMDPVTIAGQWRTGRVVGAIGRDPRVGPSGPKMDDRPLWTRRTGGRQHQPAGPRSGVQSTSRSGIGGS